MCDIERAAISDISRPPGGLSTELGGQVASARQGLPAVGVTGTSRAHWAHGRAPLLEQFDPGARLLMLD